MKYLVILIVSAAAAIAAGCATPTEGDRQLNHQNKMAGAMIEEVAAEPEVRQAGKDVKENSAVLEKNLMGAPKEPKPYSPPASAAAREQSTKEHENTWGKVIGNAVLGFLLGGVATKVITRYVGGPVGPALVSVVEGIARVREESMAKEGAAAGTLTVDELLGALMKSQEDPRVRELVKSLAHKAEAKLAAQL
jgi:hypothetical protein